MVQVRRIVSWSTGVICGAVAAATSTADLNPEWTAIVPVGTALSSGIQGFAVDGAGNSYVTGTAGSSSNTDVFTAAFDTQGALLWSHSFNGSADWHDQGRGITVSRDGFVYVVGNTPGPGLYSNVLLLKYDAATGALLNTVQYSSGPFTAEFAQTVTTDTDGNVYLGGGTVGDGPDSLILSFTDSGQFRWKRTWDGPASSPYSQDQAREVLIDPNGDLLVMMIGYMSSLQADYIVHKYSSQDGSTIWEANWGVRGGDFARDMEVDAAGDVYVTGTGIDVIDKYSTIKLAGQTGALLWQAYDSNGNDNYANALALDGSGGVYVTGGADPDGNRSNFNDNFYTVKRSADDGSLVWTHSYGENCVGCFEVPADVAVDPAGNVLITGSSDTLPYEGTVLFALDAGTGALRDAGSTFEVGGSFLAFDAAYNIYIGGGTYDPNTGEKAMSAARYASLVGDLYRLEVEELIAGRIASLSITNATPNSTQYIGYSLRGYGSTPVPQLGVVLDLDDPQLLTSGRSNASGDFTTSAFVPAAAQGRRVWLQAAEQGRVTPAFDRVVE
ncbi:MAG: SBBP repeat-containing protein [Phycisphaerales bacterium]